MVAVGPNENVGFGSLGMMTVGKLKAPVERLVFDDDTPD